MPAIRVQVSAALWYSHSCYWAPYCESRCRRATCINSAGMLGYPFTPTTWRISLSHSSKTNRFSDQPFLVNTNVSNVAFRHFRTSSQSTISHKHQHRIYSRICVVKSIMIDHHGVVNGHSFHGSEDIFTSSWYPLARSPIDMRMTPGDGSRAARQSSTTWEMQTFWKARSLPMSDILTTKFLYHFLDSVWMLFLPHD